MEKPSLGEIISCKRKEQNLTQRALAEQLNVTDKAVSKWERNISRPDIDTIPKLAQILDIPITELLNLPDAEEGHLGDQEVPQAITDTVVLTEEESMFFCKRSREHMLLLIVQGTGAILGLIAVLTSGYEIIRKLAGILVMPLACAGILRLLVRTFQIVRMKLGHKIYDGAGSHYVIPRNGLGIVGSFIALGLFTSIFVGFAHVEYASGVIMLMMGVIELFLLYTDIKIVHTAGTGRADSKVVIIFAVIILILFSVVAIMWYASEDEPPVEMDRIQSPAPTEYYMVNSSHFSDSSSELKCVYENAMNHVLEAENKQREYGHEIIIPSTLKAAYFLTTLDPANEHYDVGTGTYINNAIIVVGHYNVNIANTRPRDEWVICVFPNFTMDSNGILSYDEADEYCDYMQANGLDNVYSWLCIEYNDMSIDQLAIP